MSSGGGSGPTTSTVNQTNLPAYVEPYVTQMLGNAQSLTTTPYQQYTGQQVADFSPLQTQAMQNIQGMQPSAQTSQATGMAGLAGLQAGQYANQSNNFYDPNALQQTQAPQLNNYQMQGPQQVNTQNYTGQNVDQYMSPYMNDVVNQQKNAAIADYSRALPQLGSNAARVGGLGGTRDALMQSEANRNLQTQLQGIQATGSQAGFQNAQQQFNAQQQAQLQAQMANQNAGLQTGIQNLNANLQTQALGSGQNMQSQLANQQAALQNAGQYAQYGLGGAQLGLQGLGQQVNAANSLGNLGQQQFQQEAGINTALLGTGALQQQQQQQGLNTSYQNFLNQQNYPYTQLGFMSSLIHGLPLSQGTSNVYQAPPNTAGQVAGMGLGLGSLFGALG